MVREEARDLAHIMDNGIIKYQAVTPIGPPSPRCRSGPLVDLQHGWPTGRSYSGSPSSERLDGK